MILSVLLKSIPASWIRAAGQLQFKVPFLRPIIRRVASSMVKEGLIQRGAGKGLYFNAENCNPGFLTGTSEPLEQDLVAKYSLPGSVVYDLGANAGFYAVIAARCVGERGRVYAFEPTPDLVKRIKYNAERNSFNNLHVVEAAVSDSDGFIDFGVEGALSVENSIRSAATGATISVRSVTLDSFVSKNPPPNLVLIDIEGAEIDALKGGLEMIKKHRPILMIEVHWLGQELMSFFDTHLRSLGYTLRTYEGNHPPQESTRYHALLIAE